MDNWLFSAGSAILLYGFWGFFPKLAMAHIQPTSALIYQVAGAMLVGFLCLFLVDFRPDTHPRGVLFAFLTGVAGILGTLFYFAAARRGNISVVASMTALYPIITILLAAVFLREPITLRQLLGMVFALIAIFLFAC